MNSFNDIMCVSLASNDFAFMSKLPSDCITEVTGNQLLHSIGKFYCLHGSFCSSLRSRTSGLSLLNPYEIIYNGLSHGCIINYYVRTSHWTEIKEIFSVSASSVSHLSQKIWENRKQLKWLFAPIALFRVIH